jgi:hypothetical protein
MRDEFPKPIKDALADRSGNRCSNPDCQAVTSGPQTDPAKAANIGVAAHIAAASAGGPRYDARMTAEQRSSPENGIWLCQNCAALIDRDPTRFTVELLRAWKAVAEDRARYLIGKTFQAPAETESRRKMRKILELKDKPITLRWLNAPQHSVIAGRVRAEVDMIVEDCDEDRVRLLGMGNGSLQTLPLESILIGYDDVRHRPALEHKP